MTVRGGVRAVAGGVAESAAVELGELGGPGGEQGAAQDRDVVVLDRQFDANRSNLGLAAGHGRSLRYRSMTTAEQPGRALHPQIDNDYLRLVAGQGVFVTDDSGREYLDARCRHRRHVPRLRARGPRRGGGDPGQEDLVHALDALPERAAGAARAAARRDHAARPRLGVLLQRRLGGARLGGQARAPVLAGARAAEPLEGDRPAAELPRQHPERAVGRLPRRPPGGVRAVPAGPPAPACAVDLPVRAARHGRPVVRRLLRPRAGRRHRGGRARDRRRVHRRADRRRGGARRHPAARLLRDDPRDLRPVRGPVHRRRGDHGDRPDRPRLRDPALGRRART